METAFRYPDDGERGRRHRRGPYPARTTASLRWEACARDSRPTEVRRNHRSRSRGAHPRHAPRLVADGNRRDPRQFQSRPRRHGSAQSPVRPPHGHSPLALRAANRFPMLAALRMPSILVAARSPEHPVDPRAGFDEIVLVDGDHDLHVQQPELVADHLARVAPWA